MHETAIIYFEFVAGEVFFNFPSHYQTSGDVLVEISDYELQNYDFLSTTWMHHLYSKVNWCIP